MNQRSVEKADHYLCLTVIIKALTAGALEKSGFGALDGFNSGILIRYKTATATATIYTSCATRDSSETSFLQQAANKTVRNQAPDHLTIQPLQKGRE